MSDEKPEIQLFIKSSTIDREQKGSCPLCQQWFMAACILTEQGVLSFHVTIVDAESPPKEFKDLSQSKIFPVVKGIRGLDNRGQDIGDKLADDHEQLEKFFESFGCPDLKRDGAVQKHFDDLYKHFNAFLQNGTEQAKHRLLQHLDKLNSFLEGEDHIYVIKDSITYGDTYLMPRLQHIKVACREFADLEIPEEMFYIWRYLYEAYKTDAFQKTCPTDQDIIKHYEKKAKVFKPKKGVPSLQKSTFSFDIPESILETIESQPREGEAGSSDELYRNTHSNAFGQNNAEEESIYEAPDKSYVEEISQEMSSEPESASFEAASYEAPSYEAPNNEAASYEAANYEAPSNVASNYETAGYEALSDEAATYEAPSNDYASYEAPSYEAPDGGQEADTTTSYDALGYTGPEASYVNQDAEMAVNGSPARSTSPDPLQTASPARSVSPAADGGTDLNDSLEQTYDDPSNFDPPGLPPKSHEHPEPVYDDTTTADSTTPTGQDDALYENVDISVTEPSNNTKSVDFTVPDQSDVSAKEPGVEIKVNGTNGHQNDHL